MKPTTTPADQPDRLVTALLVFSALLMLLTSVSAWLYLTNPRPTSIQTARGLASVSIANRFYDVVNESIRSGDFDLLTQVASADLIEHPSRYETTSGLDRLLHSITSIRASAPHTQLIVDSAIASGNGETVTLRIHTVGSRGATLLGSPLPLEFSSWGWGPIELLRIEGGKVIERWGGTESGVSVDQLEQVTMPPAAPAQARQVAMIRLHLDPNANLEITNGLTSRFFRVESGSVTVSYEGDRDSTMSPPQYSIPVVAPTHSPLQSPVMMGAGMSLLTFPGDNLLLQNEGDSPATILLVVRFGVSSATATPEERKTTIDEELNRLTQPRPAGVDAQLLASGVLPSNTSSQIYALARVTIDDGHSITWERIDQPMMISVEESEFGRSSFAVSSCLDSLQSGANAGNSSSLTLPETECPTVWRDDGDAPVSLIVLALLEPKPQK